MKTVNYKGYQASVEFDDGSLFVKVLHIDDLLIGECDGASEAQAVAEELIDSYLADCKEAGREPAKPFKGTFNVRVSPELHKKVAMRAAEDGCSLNSWVGMAMEEKLECGKLSERIDGVFTETRLRFDDEAMSQWVQAVRIWEEPSSPRSKMGVIPGHGSWKSEHGSNVTVFPLTELLASRNKAKMHG